MFAESLKLLRKENGLTQQQFAQKFNISNGTIAMWETGKREPDFSTVQRIADFFDVSVDHVLGRPSANSTNPIRVPVLGTIPAGVPLEAIEDILDWEELPPEMGRGGKEYFGLQVKGDSMYPDFLDGDVVILEKLPCCESGDVCAVFVNGYEATLKKVKLDEDGSVTLKPRNPEYPPRTYTPQEVAELPVSIAGVVVELRRKIKK